MAVIGDWIFLCTAASIYFSGVQFQAPVFCLRHNYCIGMLQSEKYLKHQRSV